MGKFAVRSSFLNIEVECVKMPVMFYLLFYPHTRAGGVEPGGGDFFFSPFKATVSQLFSQTPN